MRLGRVAEGLHSQEISATPARNSSEAKARWRPLFAFRGEPSTSIEIGVGLTAVVAVLGGWELCSGVGLISPLFLPSPSRVLAAMWTMFSTQHLAWHAGVSIARVWMAFLLATLMAVPIGILMSSYRIVGASLEPIIDFIRYLPIPALVPLTIIWFGVGEETKIFLLARHLLSTGPACGGRHAPRAA